MSFLFSCIVPCSDCKIVKLLYENVYFDDTLNLKRTLVAVQCSSIPRESTVTSEAVQSKVRMAIRRAWMQNLGMVFGQKLMPLFLSNSN